MAEDVLDSTSTSAGVLSDSKVISDPFRKPMLKNNEKETNKVKSMSVKNVDSGIGESKKKKEKLSSKGLNKGENEDATESVDSGCIADIAGEMTDWPQVQEAVLEERNYVLSLLSWLPDFQWVLPPSRPPRKAPKVENVPEDNDNNKNAKRKRADRRQGTQVKLRDFLNEKDEIDDLSEKYQAMLAELKKGRKDKEHKKRVNKLQKKLKNLTRREKKNANRQRKLEQAQITRPEQKALESRKVVRKNIFNEKGKLVFSKFDFSTDGSGSRTKGAKNLENKVAEAIKEREMRKRLLQKGDTKGATEIRESKAWSNAMKRAEGTKVRDDLEMLQKSLKKKENRKKLSKKRWEERTESLDKKMKEKQAKRQENLKSRREAKLAKGKKKKQKGRNVPGF